MNTLKDDENHPFIKFLINDIYVSCYTYTLYSILSIE